MKKIAALLIIAIGSVSNAQEDKLVYGFEKKDFFIDAAISYRFNDAVTSVSTLNNSDGIPSLVSIREQETNSLVFSSRAGFFISNHIALGINIQYSSLDIERENVSGPDLDTRRYAIGAFGRYYYTPQQRFSIFNTLTVSYVDVQNQLLFDELNANGFDIRADIGAYYFLSKHFAIQSFFGLISYQTTNTDLENTVGSDSTNNSSFNVDLNIRNINFGLIYKF